MTKITDEQLSDYVMAAIFDGGAFPVTTEIHVGDKTIERTLYMKWPTFAEEQQIGTLTAAYTDGFSGELLAADITLARARATIEVLAMPNPGGGFPEFLPPSDKPMIVGGKQRLVPDTSKMRSRALAVSLYSAFREVYDRFQELAL